MPFALALLLLAAEAPLTAKLEPVPPPPVLSAVHRRVLDSRPLVVRAGAEPIMRVWFRTEIPVTATGEELRSGLAYRRIPSGTLVGAVELPKTFVDYRNQRLAPGVYTLRFALQPDTGDHTDTAPHREFFLLSPAAEDPSTDAMEPKRLIELSSKVNQGRHPAVLLLWPHPGPDGVVDQGNGVRIAPITRPAASGARKGTLRFALTIAGFWQQ
jgi:hypothetical protein